MVSWIHRCGKAEMQYEGTAEKSLLPRGRQEQKDRKGGTRDKTLLQECYHCGLSRNSI